MRAHHWPAKTAPRSAAALRSTGPSIHPLPPTPLTCPSAPRCPLPNGFCLAQYDLARCRLLRLSELAVGDDYGATIPAPRCSALRASHGPSICRAVAYAATLERIQAVHPIKSAPLRHRVWHLRDRHEGGREITCICGRSARAAQNHHIRYARTERISLAILPPPRRRFAQNDQPHLSGTHGSRECLVLRMAILPGLSALRPCADVGGARFCGSRPPS